MASPRPAGHPALPLAAWPAADRAAYERACILGGPFDEGGQAACWRPASHKALLGAYGRWLGFLHNQVVVLEDEGPAERMTPARIDAYVRFLAGRCAPVTVSSYLGQLHMMMRDVWPDHDWAWLCAVQARAQRFAEPSRNKDARIVPQQDLLRLGCELMQQAAAMSMPEDLRAGPDHPALLFRDGLIIALLAMRPLRQRNFLALQIGRCLRRDRDGWQIHIPAAECKTHMALHMAFPEVLVPALEAYIHQYRPRLMAMQGPRNPATAGRPVGFHLWVSRCGTWITEGALQKALARHTRARFGHHVNVHLFRDCAATSLADNNPEHVRLAADLLGHRSFQTTMTHYISARQRTALRHCQAVIAQRRKTNRHDQSEHKGRRL
jgi:hypothetical protein